MLRRFAALARSSELSPSPQLARDTTKAECERRRISAANEEAKGSQSQPPKSRFVRRVGRRSSLFATFQRDEHVLTDDKRTMVQEVRRSFLQECTEFCTFIAVVDCNTRSA